MSSVEHGIGPARYSPEVWRRFQEAKHAGKPEGCATGCAESAAHHLRVCLHVRLQDGAVAAAGFNALGCPTTIAAADFCAERLLAGERPEAAAMTAALEIPDAHRHCVLLCEDALQELWRATGIKDLP